MAPGEIHRSLRADGMRGNLNQSLPSGFRIAPVLAALRSAREHLDQIVVYAIVKLPLESPVKLGMVQISGMHLEIVSVNRNRRVLKPNDHLHAIAAGLGVEFQ